MALKNFIKPGTYTRIERVDYSKHLKNLCMVICVYEDETTTNKMMEYPIYINGFANEAIINDIITDASFLENVDNITTDKYLIAIEGETDEITSSVNNFVIYLNDQGILSSLKPIFIYNEKDGKYYKRNDLDNKYYETTKIESEKKFLEFFESDVNKFKLCYDYLKSLPEYSNCIDA